MTWLTAALDALQPARDPDRLKQICVCELDDCYCLETAELTLAEIQAAQDPRAAYTCGACRDGRHVDMNGLRA
jgi:hypothetical protein